MNDNPTNRAVNRDGDFTHTKSFNYTDIREGTVELTSFTQPGGAGTAITAVTFEAIRGRNYTISSPSIVDTDITGYFAGVGLAPTAARSFDLSFVVNYTGHYPLNSSPSTIAILEADLSATGAAGVTINSSTVFVSDVSRQSLTVHAILEIWGASNAAIYNFLATLLGNNPRLDFVTKSTQNN